MKRTRFPKGWNEERVRKVLDHYERQTPARAAAEDDAAFRKPGQTVMTVPTEMVHEITQLIEKRSVGKAKMS